MSTAIAPRGSGEFSGITQYLADIQRYPLLPRGEENELACRARDGDARARDILIRSNLRFVVAIAKRYTGNGVALEDLINEGNLGLVKAAERFDPDRGYKFISYAVWWIRQSILHSVSENSRLVRLPMNRVALAQKASRLARQLEQELGRSAYVDEIARELSVTAQEVEEVVTLSRGHLSIDEPVHDDGDETTFAEQIEDLAAESPDADLIAEMRHRDVHRALDHLSERERYILLRYYGLDGRDALTLEQIGRELGYTRERIRQVKEQAIERLRSRASVRHIAEYLNA